MKKFKALAQVVGFVTLGVLALYGALMLCGGGDLVRAATGHGPAQATDATSGGVTPVMNYQGRLKDDAGNPLEGTYTMTFRIYNHITQTGASAVEWTETMADVTVRDGYFDVLLGYTNPLPDDLFSEPDRFVGVAVDPHPEMTPRQRFASVPYAFFAQSAFSLAAADGDPLNAVTVDDEGRVGINNPAQAVSLDVGGAVAVGSNMSVGGDTTLNGKVGIGTTNPDRPLSVQGTGVYTEWISFKDGNGDTKWHINNRYDGLNFAETGVADGRLFLGQGGNVGIGTTDPGRELDVVGNARVIGNAGVSGNFGIGTGPHATYNLDVAGDARVSGNVGIGTVPNGYRLNVNGDARVYGSVSMNRVYQVFYGYTGHSESLGTWDFCAISAYEISGPDMYAEDYGACSITFDSETADDWEDKGPTSKTADQQRPDWHLRVYRGSEDVDWVKCEAICFRFTDN